MVEDRVKKGKRKKKRREREERERKWRRKWRQLEEKKKVPSFFIVRGEEESEFNFRWGQGDRK